MGKYTEIRHFFREGQILKNNNGYDYKVVNATMQSRVLFERVKDGEKVYGIYPKMFTKVSDDGTESDVLEWAWGKYM